MIGQGKMAADDMECQFLFISVYLEIGASNRSET